MNKEKVWVIYSLTFPNTKRYVGQTGDFKKRMPRHKSNASRGVDYLVYRAIRKYGWENIEKKIELTCPIEEADKWETKYISTWNLTDKKFGYNTEGGGNVNKIISEEARLKTAISGGAKPFQVFKDNVLIGEWINQHQCAGDLNLDYRSINSCLRKKLKTHKGYYFIYENELKVITPEEYINQLEKERIYNRSIAQGGRFFQVFKDGKLIDEWINQKQCARELDLDNQNISACLFKKRKTHKGYTFKFKE